MAQQKIPEEVTGAIISKVVDLLINLVKKYLPIIEIKSKRKERKRAENTPKKSDD